MDNAHTYKVKVRAQITIMEEMTMCLVVEPGQDVEKAAAEAFTDSVNNLYGWADVDEVKVDDIEDMGELPF